MSEAPPRCSCRSPSCVHAELEIASATVALTWRYETAIERHLGPVVWADTRNRALAAVGNCTLPAT